VGSNHVGLISETESTENCMTNINFNNDFYFFTTQTGAAGISIFKQDIFLI